MKTNSNLPKVSVMIITYNQAHLLEETLKSVISQTYSNLEIIISDDCSTDNSKEILQNYQTLYPDLIRVIFNNNNLGITANSNKAFFECNGDFVAIMGGDDIFFRNKIEEQLKTFTNDEEVVLSYHPVEIFQSETNKTVYITNQSKNENITSVKDIIIGTGIHGASSVMVRRSACPAYGFDPRLPTVSDWKFFIDVALKGKVVKTDVILGRYRKHAMGVTHDSLKLLKDSLLTLDYVIAENPNELTLHEWCKKGKARYLAGEAYRQMSIQPRLAAKLIVEALTLDPSSVRIKALLTLSKLPFLYPLAKVILPRIKYFLKKNLV